MIINGINLVKTISCFNVEKKKLKLILSDEYEICSCDVTMGHMMQWKHMISYNKLFSMWNIGKFWYKKDTITQSHNISTYISPRLNKLYTEIEDVNTFLLINVEHLEDIHFSNSISTSFD